MVVLCLSIMVRNEEKNIIRCLNSVSSIINSLVVVDTGSTDQTKELIIQWAHEHDVPLDLSDQPFQNFGFNRTLLFQSTQKYLTGHHYNLDETYLLLLDADMILSSYGSITSLKEDYYTIPQKDSNFIYPNIRLMKARNNWKCYLTTHEIWIPEINSLTCDHLGDWLIDDRGDGGCKHDKFERDCRLLKKGLEEVENEPLPYQVYFKSRYYFYLGLTYYYEFHKSPHLQDEYRKESLLWFRKRLEIPLFLDERYYTYYTLGMLYFDEHNYSQSIFYLDHASRLCPIRPEPLYYLYIIYKEEGDLEKAQSLLRNAQEILSQLTDKDCLNFLFFDYKIYRYLNILK